MPKGHVILVVDDHEASRYALGRGLQMGGYEVVEAATGAAALKILLDGGADLAVLDVNLPDMSGMDVCRSIKSNPASALIPILQVSAEFTSTTDRVKALEGGADAFLVMPIEPSELLAQVGALLRVREAETARLEAEREATRNQEALAQKSAELEAVFSGMSEGINIADLDGNLLRMNRASADLLGYACEADYRRALKDFADTWELRFLNGKVMPLEEWPLSRVLRGEILQDYEAVAIRRDTGSRRVFSYHGRQVCDFSGKPVLAVVTFRDITERRAFEEELEKQVEQRTRELRELNEQFNTFCYSMAHDLKAPLRAQVAFATLLEEDYGSALGAVGREYLERIAQAAQRQSRLLSDLLSHMSVVRADLPIQPTDLAAAIEFARKELAAEIEQRKAKLQIGPLQGPVLANEASLQLVLVNLLSNALKFVEQDCPPTVRVWSEPVADGSTELQGTSGAAPRVRLWVEDDGIGIPPEFREKIFGVFERLHPTRGYPGTGIGLAVVKAAVDRMGGKVGVQAGVEKGSRFWIELKHAT